MRTQLNTNPKLAGRSISVHSISGNWEGKVLLSFASNIQKYEVFSLILQKPQNELFFWNRPFGRVG